LNKRYPWDSLEKPGDSFVWKKIEDERSLRSQANKQSTRRGLVYRVNKRRRVNSRAKPVPELVVTLVHGLF